MILFGKFHIHKSKINNSKPCSKVFMVDVHSYMDSLQFIDSKQFKDTIEFAKELNLVEKGSNIWCILDYWHLVAVFSLYSCQNVYLC